MTWRIFKNFILSVSSLVKGEEIKEIPLKR
jgi:hypothetical protein